MEPTEENSTSNILVICRFRPLNELEINYSQNVIYSLEPDNKTVKIASQFESEPQKFTFDYIFETDCSQVEVYDLSAKPIVQAVMQGFNGTVFAYGQTASGKTYTMTGLSLYDYEDMGIIPRMVSTVFEQISDSDPWIEYSVKVSYCEIYLEKLRDLLDPSKENLKIHQDKTRGVFISELTEKYVANGNEVFELMKQGIENRVVGVTNMNQQSSRSHSLFSITINQTNKRDYISKTGKLYLVDLAGSEKVSKTSAVGLRLEEAKNINKSLTMLGLVIYSLTDGKSTHIPYRDSKLTRILQDSLGGNAKTSLIITCSPSIYNEAETISTLRFGVRAKCIKNKPKVNREFTVAELKIMLAKCREELTKKDKYIEALENHKSKPTKKNIVDVKDESVHIEDNNEYEEIIAELEDTRTKLQEEVKFSLKLKQETEEKENELGHLKAITEVVNKKNQELKKKINLCETDCKTQGDTIEKLSLIKDSLEQELQQANYKIMQLENLLHEKENEKNSPTKPTPRLAIEELHQLLIKEQAENTAKSRENAIIRQNLTEILNKKLPETKLSQILQDELLSKEHEKWLEEKNCLKREFLARVNKIIELEAQLLNSKQNYKNLESMLSQGERALKRKTDTLERNLEQLTIMYNQLVSQKSQISVEKTLAEKKLSRVSETIKKLQEELERCKADLEHSQQLNEIMKEEFSMAHFMRNRSRKNTGNCLITINGGSIVGKGGIPAN